MHSISTTEVTHGICLKVVKSFIALPWEENVVLLQSLHSMFVSVFRINCKVTIISVTGQS